MRQAPGSAHVRVAPHRAATRPRWPAPRRRRCGRSIATRRLPASMRSAEPARAAQAEPPIHDAAARRVCRGGARARGHRRLRRARATRRRSGRRRSASAWRSAPIAARFCGWCSPSGARIAAIGLAIGIAGALALTQVLSGLLFGVSARDPLTFLVVPGALLPSRLAACWIPARRAIRVEPVIACEENLASAPRHDTRRKIGAFRV